MQKNKAAFTLIELIIVIVILGILAVTAAPKFIDIQADAEGAALKGVKGALQGGSQLVYAKAAIAGKQKNAATGTPSSQVSIGSNTVELDFGYPQATGTDLTKINFWVDLSADDFDLDVGAGSAETANPALGSFGIAPKNSTPDYATPANGCHVLYTEAVNADTPSVVTIVTAGC